MSEDMCDLAGKNFLSDWDIVLRVYFSHNQISVMDGIRALKYCVAMKMLLTTLICLCFQMP